MAARGEIDMTLVAELLEQIEREPPGIEMRKLLVEQYLAANWMDWAVGAVNELYKLCPKDAQVRQWYDIFCKNAVDEFSATPNPSQAPSSRRASSPPRIARPHIFHRGFRKAQGSAWRGLSTASSSATSHKFSRGKAKATPPSKPSQGDRVATNFSSDPHINSGLEALQAQYAALLDNAASLLKDLTLLSRLDSGTVKGKRKVDDDYVTTETILGNLAAGNITSVLKGKMSFTSPKAPVPAPARVPKSLYQPKTTRALAKHMKSNPLSAGNIAMEDTEQMASLLKEKGDNPEAVRKQLYKRVQDIVTLLPTELRVYPQIALMHLDHEIFDKTYANTTTMLGDDVADIPRENFIATEDGYAWDMDELRQAITAKNGFMSNPLTKNMFTPADVQLILHHPLGKSLGALQVEQNKLRKGVRSKTIDEMERIARILLEDMTEDALPSRVAVDEFMAYNATLPVAEQDAIENLRVPARDSHTGQSFDGSIGETIRDAKANKLCFHKAAKWRIIWQAHRAEGKYIRDFANVRSAFETARQPDWSNHAYNSISGAKYEVERSPA